MTWGDRANPAEQEIRQRAYEIWLANGCPSGTQETDWLQASNQILRERRSRPPNFFWVWLVLSCVLWLAVVGVISFSSYVTPRLVVPEESGTKSGIAKYSWKDINATPTTLPALRVVSPATQPAAEWSRERAVEFGFTQLAFRLNATLVGAGGVLWFVTKRLTEMPAKLPAKSRRATWAATVLSWNIVLGCCFSIFYGFLGLLMFSELITRSVFSYYGYLQVFLKAQSLSFVVVAAMLLGLIALSFYTRPVESEGLA